MSYDQATVAIVDSIATLAGLAHAPSTILVEGYATPNDGGGGLFSWYPGDATPANGGTVIEPTGGPVGRYKRNYSGGLPNVRWFGAKGDGITNDAPAINATLAATLSGEVFLPAGEYAVTAEIVVGDNQILVGDGAEATIILATAGNINLIHVTGSYGGARDLRVEGNGQTTVSGLRVTPANESQTTTVVNQNYNRFRDLVVSGCTEGIVLQCGPFVGGVDSGCWYNTFETTHVLSCLRGVWFKNGPNASSSGSNRNNFVSVRIGGAGSNTGVQIDSGGGNSFFGCAFEGIATGTTPNATPTAILIANTGLYSGANESNRFFGANNDACTLDLNNANNESEFYGCLLFTFVLTAMPRALLGGYSASVVPQITEWMIYQANGQISGYPNATLNLLQGQLGFPAIENPSTDPNTLDDYEEGTWTPTLNATGLSGATYSIQTGHYVKIGRQVLFWAHVKLSALTSGGTNFLRIEGLPFTSSEPDAAVTVEWDALTGGVSGQWPVARITGNGQTVINFIEVNNNGIVSGSWMSGARLTATSEFWVSGEYVTTS
jgi:hypothetical protein